MHRENTRAATTRGALQFSAEIATESFSEGRMPFLNGANEKKKKILEGKMEFVMCLFSGFDAGCLPNLLCCCCCRGLVGVKGPMVAD